MFFPYGTSWQLYINNSCLKFEIYCRHDLLAVTNDTIFLVLPQKHNNLLKGILIGGFLGFHLNMTSWWLSCELRFHNKPCFKFAAQYELENLQLKIRCMSRST